MPARSGGPGAVQITSAGNLLLDGQSGPAATLELAHLIEGGANPFAGTSAAQQKKLLATFTTALAATGSAKPTSDATLARSAAATALLSLAQVGGADVRKKALSTYAGAMTREKVSGLQASMLVNLDSTHLSLEGPQLDAAATVRGKLLPERPPYEEWFTGAHPTLNVKHYVMDDFWRQELSAYRGRGFTVGAQTATRIELTKDLVDPTGANPPVKAHVTLEKGYANVYRDMDDPKTQMIVYSGHAQLGGVADSSIAAGPNAMKGTKLVQAYSCRGKQTAGDFLAKYPGAHLTSTASSAYGPDDEEVLSQTYDMIAKRGTYGQLYRGLNGGDMIQPKSNYMLPNDPRMLATLDGDRDGLGDLTALGADKFFDPSRAKGNGGKVDFKPRATSGDPQSLPGEKLDHALGYANTAFYYFAEENHAAPLTKRQSDKFLSAGWFTGATDEPVRVTKSHKDGETYYQVAVNSNLSGQSREVIASTVLYELQKQLCLDRNGKFTETDKLRGLMLVGGYVDMMVEYANDCDNVVKKFGEHYGFGNVSYDTLAKASERDGHEGTATLAALDYLHRRGVTAPI